VREQGASALPSFALAQSSPMRLGLMTVKTGPLASGGIDMERALVQYLKERNSTMAGRKVELFVGDSGGVPRSRAPSSRKAGRARQDPDHDRAPGHRLGARSDDYIRSQQLLTLSVAAART